jgi:hypothetical protein
VIKIEAEKILRYKDLIKEIQPIPGKQEIKKIKKKQPYWALHTYFGNY